MAQTVVYLSGLGCNIEVAQRLAPIKWSIHPSDDGLFAYCDARISSEKTQEECFVAAAKFIKDYGFDFFTAFPAPVNQYQIQVLVYCDTRYVIFPEEISELIKLYGPGISFSLMEEQGIICAIGLHPALLQIK